MSAKFDGGVDLDVELLGSYSVGVVVCLCGGWQGQGWGGGGCAEVERHAYVFGFVSGEACEVNSALQTAWTVIVWMKAI